MKGTADACVLTGSKEKLSRKNSSRKAVFDNNFAWYRDCCNGGNSSYKATSVNIQTAGDFLPLQCLSYCYYYLWPFLFVYYIL
ncbi:hypothetical protein QE152_g39525 [Popillia japonica]|uniref:Uncharacterized protein n=1 Tax=Popillia japonica TaxID=7064 RepID=A0AAW1HTW7_POPJA